jgi:hypothetical protein
MKYTLERIHNIYGVFWAIYENTNEFVQRTIFYSRSYEEAMKKWKALHDE